MSSFSTFDQFNASLLNKTYSFLSETFYWPQTFEQYYFYFYKITLCEKLVLCFRYSIMHCVLWFFCIWVTFNILTLVWLSFSGLLLTQPARMPPRWLCCRRWVSVTSRSIKGCWGSITTICLMWSTSWCSWPTANGTSQDLRKHRATSIKCKNCKWFHRVAAFCLNSSGAMMKWSLMLFC